MDDDNIFDEDDALDYIIYDEIDKREQGANKSGCLTFIIVLFIPTTLLYPISRYLYDIIK